MQKLYNIASLSLLWLVLTSYSTGLLTSSAMASADTELAEPFPSKGQTAFLSLTCQDTIIVSLDAQCQFPLSLNHVATGSIPGCLTADDFQVLVDDTDPTNQAIVDGCGMWRYYLGLQDSALDCSDFQPCWGVIRAEDKAPPVITPPASITLDLSCIDLDTILNQRSSLAFTGLAEVQDNCSGGASPLSDFTDVLSVGEVCKDLLIQRTFFAEDEKGNRATAIQEIRLLKPNLAAISLATPVFKYDVDCTTDAAYLLDDKGHIHPDLTGYPSFVNEFGEVVALDRDVCGIAATYVDQLFEVCEATHKIERTWVISDWCTGATRQIEQLIIVGDLAAPHLSFDQETYDFSTSPFTCTGNIKLIQPRIEEQCSTTETQVELYRVNTRLNGERDTSFVNAKALTTTTSYFEQVERGEYLLVYLTKDACKNGSKDTVQARVRDLVKPVARCLDQLRVTLDNYGFAKATALDINEGSSDNCQLDSLLLRRFYEQDEACAPLKVADYSDWADEVYFNCCDLAASVKVELRAQDKSGNRSICWAEVIIEDKEAPECQAPAAAIIDCDSLPPGFDFTDTAALAHYFGTATAIEYCLATSVIEYSPQVDLSQCGYGVVTRTFAIQDEMGKISTERCEQTIEIQPVHHYEVKFPQDYSTVCAEPDPDSLAVNTFGCDLIAVSSNDTRHSAASDECFKIFRKFRVINWCEYDGVSDAFIIPRDVDCDGMPGDEEVYLMVRPDGTVYLDANNNERDSFPVADPTYDCFGQQGNPNGFWTNSDSFPPLISRGFWEYTQIIKVTDTIAPTIFVEDSIYVCITEDNCFAKATVSFAILDECVDGDVVIKTYVENLKNEYQEYNEDPWSLVGRYPKYLMSGIVPEGSYRVEIEASDQCGNVSQAAYHLEVVDCKAPGITCRDGIVVELMPQASGTDVDNDGDFDSAANTIGVEALIASPAKDDCSAPVSYSINRAGVLPDQNQKTLTVTCEDGEFLNIEVYAWDSANNPTAIQPNGRPGGANYDHCKTFVRIQDNQNACNPAEGSIDIAGVITSATGEAMPNVEVILSGADSKLAHSDVEGAFYMAGLREGHDYTIAPRKQDELLKGVSTLDIIYISKHILGIQPFTLDLQLLAADINRSGSVSTYDIILLRKAILHVDTSAINRVGWEFIHANTILDNQGDPWSKPIYNFISLNDIEFPRGDLDFIGIKMGDVSGLQGLRSGGEPTAIRLHNNYVKAGERVRLPVYLPAQQDWEGVQLSFGLDRAFAKNLYLQSAFLERSQYSLSEKEERVNISWDRYTGTTPLDAQPLLYLEWEALRDGTLAEQLQLATRVRPSEGYTAHQVVPLHLAWEAEQLPEARVYPNPFQNTVHLSWKVTSLAADLHIFLIDTQGRTIERYQLAAGNGQTGKLRLDLPSGLPAGIYFLQVKNGDYQKRFRLVKVAR